MNRINDYKIIGNDSTGDINTFDPDLIFNLGSKLIFEVSSPGHPFLIKSEPGIGKKKFSQRNRKKWFI